MTSRKPTRQDIEDLLVEWFMEAVSAVVELEIRKKLDKNKNRGNRRDQSGNRRDSQGE